MLTLWRFLGVGVVTGVELSKRLCEATVALFDGVRVFVVLWW